MTRKSQLTLADLAKLAGVSTSTASRALNNNPVIKQSTRERIQALAREHNFSLNATASRLRTQKSRVVAVILNLSEHTKQSVNDPFLLKVVADLNQALNAKGYELLLSNSFMATDDWANYFINSRRADGLLVIGQGKDDSKMIAAAKAGVPIVVWGDQKTATGYPIVGSDNRLGGRLATEHLLARGCRRIVFLGDPEHAELSERHKGFLEALGDAGKPVTPASTLAIDITSQAAAQRINDEILAHGLNFDGIVACSDMVALGALNALKQRYVNIPGDVAIVGFDDIPMAEVVYPSLTTIHQDTTAAANIMVEQLLRQFDGKQAESITIDISLVRRDTA